ncbi:MAG: phosphotransferase family protein [Proteobacteria bacterium]|nr:phosphotransferase family protein [Pseudomonadota bacterium]
MSASRTPESALEGIAGWEHAIIRELSGGMSNRTYLVEAHGHRAVLKIDDLPRTAPFNSREAEARVQTAAAAQDMAGRVLFVDEQTYLSEYLEGQVWGAGDLLLRQNLIDLAAALKRLHALPLTGRNFDAASAARRYRASIADSEDGLARHCAQIVTSMRAPQILKCCHNDLVAENIIRARHLCFLDWEYACDNDPFFDLATIIAHHELQDDQADLLLNAYCDGDGARWRPHLQEQMRLYDALHWLWLAARTDSDDALLARIAGRFL